MHLYTFITVLPGKPKKLKRISFNLCKSSNLYLTHYKTKGENYKSINLITVIVLEKNSYRCVQKNEIKEASWQVLCRQTNLQMLHVWFSRMNSPVKILTKLGWGWGCCSWSATKNVTKQKVKSRKMFPGIFS